MTILLPADNIIRESIVPRSGQILDGRGQTYILRAGWDFVPIHLEHVECVRLRDLTIIAERDDLERLGGLVNIVHSNRITLDNVRLIGSGDDGGSRHQTICYVQHSDDVTLNDCDMSYSPKSWNLWLGYTKNVRISGGDYHHGFYDGIKVGTANSRTMILNAKCHHNGRKSAGKKATGDGIDITHGASGGCDIIGVHCYENDNGLTMKYAPWRDTTLSEKRIPIYGVNIVGGSYDSNGNGLFLQGYSGAPPAGCDGSNCPFPMGINVRGVSTNFNDNSGIVVGAGSINLTDCLTYRNRKHGLDLSASTEWCVVRNLRSIANSETNVNQWGKHNSFYNCFLDGRDAIGNDFDSVESLPKITKLGFNWQWKPARGKAHGVVHHCFNHGSQGGNDKPNHLPDHKWEDLS